MGPLQLVAGGLYCLMMMYGACALAVPYFHGETRRIPEWRFLLLAILLPIGVSYFVVFTHAVASRGVEGSPARTVMVVSLLLPASLAWLYLGHEDAESGPRARIRRALELELSGVDEALRKDPNDALSHWSRARTLEALDDYEGASVAFARAGALSVKVMPPPELTHHLSRLADLEERRKSREERRKAAFGAGRGGRIEAAFFLAGLCLLPWSWRMALQLCSYMLFVRWFRLREAD